MIKLKIMKKNTDKKLIAQIMLGIICVVWPLSILVARLLFGIKVAKDISLGLIGYFSEGQSVFIFVGVGVLGIAILQSLLTKDHGHDH